MRHRRRSKIESGHDQAVLLAHYRERVRQKEAERFWSIRPETGKDKVVAFKQAAV
jgi:hypothetical protein